MLQEFISEFFYTERVWVELVASLASTFYVILAMRQSLWCWPWGVLGAVLYVYVFFYARYYALTTEYSFYFFLCLYGWMNWSRGDRAGHELPVRHVRPTEGSVLLGIGVVGWLGIGFLLWRFTDANLPFRDSLTTTFALIAQWMTAKKILESWAVWLVVNLIYLTMFAIANLWFTFAYFVFLAVLSVLGWIAWRRSMGAPGQSSPAEDAGIAE